MADEPTTSTPGAEAPPSAPAESTSAPAASESIEPTTGQKVSRSIVEQATQEIDAFWERHGEIRRDARGRFTRSEPAPTAEPVAEATPEPAATVDTTPPPAEPQATPSPTVDEAAIEQRVRERIAAEQQATQQAENKVKAEADYRRSVEVYRGQEADHAAVTAALRQYNLTGDMRLLDALDVPLATLDGVKTISQIKDGTTGLTPEEAANVLNTWEIARRYEDSLGDRKVQRIVDLWNQHVMAELAHEDVDAASVTAHDTPAAQMRALRESVTAKVSARVEAPLRAEIARLTAEGAAKDERIASLLTERGSLTSQQRASEAAVVDRPGVGGSRSTRPGVPTTAEEVRQLSDREFDAVADELFARLGNPSARRGMRRVV